MELRDYNPRDRYRRRSLDRFFGLFVIMAIAACFFAGGFYFGKLRRGQEGIALREEFAVLAAERDKLQESITGLRAEAQTATLRFEEAQKTYQDVAPGGAAGEVMELVSKELAGGTDPQRLIFLIRSARPPRNCIDPETRRFIVSTPAYSGAESTVGIENGAIIVKGAGTSARNAKGENEAWYDPTKTVNLEFVITDAKGARTEKKQGAMPISHAVVMGEREYRFTVSEGARSFAKVTYDSCDYP